MEPSLSIDPEAPTPDESELSFIMAEFSALRTEIENHLQDRKKLDAQVITGVVASYVWIFTRPEGVNEDLISVSLIIPPALCVFGFLKWLGMMSKMFSAADYIVQVEKALLRTQFFGWEHFVQRRRINRPIVGRFEGTAEVLFWATIIPSTIALSIFAIGRI